MRAAKLAAAAAALKRASGGISAPFSLAFLTDRRRVARPEPVFRALPAGAAVIYRDYDDPKRAAIARRYAAICRRRGVLFLVAGDEALARAVGADGVHWPAWMLPPSPACGRGAGGDGRQRFPSPLTPLPQAGEGEQSERFLLTIACHDERELARAAAIGADLAFLSPVFATQSHPDTEHLGAARFKALAAESAIPVLALGGVDEGNARLLAGRNAAGIAAIGAFLDQGYFVQR